MIEDWKRVDIWAESDIEFDRRTGVKTIRAPYPAWFNRSKLDDLKADRDSKQAQLNAPIDRFMGSAPPLLDEAAKADARAQVRHYEQQIDIVEGARPELSSKLRDELHQTYLKMGDLIGESMFTKTAQQEGYPDPYKEAMRMKSPVIPVDNDIRRWMQKCNQHTKIVDNKVGRDPMTICWQIAGELLNEETNSESLRPSDPYDGRVTKKAVMAEQVE